LREVKRPRRGMARRRVHARAHRTTGVRRPSASASSGPSWALRRRHYGSPTSSRAPCTWPCRGGVGGVRATGA